MDTLNNNTLNTSDNCIDDWQDSCFVEIFDMTEIQHMQDLFADAHGVASLITDIDGNPITKPSNFSHFCENIIRKTELGCANCFKSDAILGSYNPKSANVQQCLSGGLWDAGASITVGGKHIANWLIGQVRNEDVDIEKLMQYADEIDADSDAYKAAFEKVPVMSADKFTKIANLLFVIANELSEKAYSNLQLRNQIVKSELANKLLKESEERFQLLFNKAPLGYQSLDINGCFIEVNQQWLDTLGYERHEVVGKWFGDFLTPMFQAGFRERFPIFKAQGHIHSEFEMLHKNGGIRFIAFDGKIGNDVEGNFKQTHCILQDITESKRTMDALKESEELHRTILQTAMDGFWLVGDNGRLLEVNEAYCKMSGYSEVELLGMRIADVEAVENTTDINDHISKIKKLQADRFETKHKRKDGFIYDVEITVKYIANNKFVVFLRDITEAKNAKTALLDAEWKFKALFELGPIGVAYHRMMYDEAGAPIDYYFIDANASYKELTGVNPVGMTVLEAFPGIENDPANWIGIFGNVAKTGETFRFEQFLQSNERWYDCVAYQYKPDHFVAAFTEITQRKAAEAQLQAEKLRLALIIEGTNVATWEWNVQTGATIFNERWAEMIGYTLEELMPISIETWAKFAHPDDLNTATELLNKHFAGELDFYETETRMRHKNGDWVWIFDRGRVHTWTKDGQPLLMSGTHQDISDRKYAELAFKENEEKFRKFFENSVVGMSITSIDGKLHVNNSFSRILGYTECELNNLNWKEITHTDDIEQNQNIISTILKGEKPSHRWEKRYIHKMGHTVWTDISTTLQRDEKGNPDYFLTAVIDVTARKLAEEALRINQERFRIAQDMSPDGFTILRPMYDDDNNSEVVDFRWIYENLAVSKMNGTNPQDIIGKSLLEEFPSHKGSEIFRKYKNVAETGISAIFEIDFKIDTALNSTFLRLVIVPMGQDIAILAQDITEQKQTLYALRESEERFRATFEQAAVGIAQVGVDGKWLRVNQRLCEIVGYEHDDLFTITFRDITHKDDLQKDLDNFDQLLAGEINNYSIEKRYIKKNGSHVWVNLTVGLVRDALNAPKYFVSVVEDITERKKTELMLENQRELYLDLVNTQPAGIYRIRVSPKESWENNAWRKSETAPYKMELISDRFCEILEITPDLFERQPGIVIDLLHPDDKEEFVRKNDEANTTVSTFSMDCRLLINNNIKWVHFESLPRKLENGDILYTGIIYDITEQKIAHEKLQESEMRFRKILQDVDSLSVQGYAPDGTVQYWNKASELMYGYTAEEAIGRNFVDLIVSPDMRESALQNYLQLAETCQSIPASEYSFMRKDGSLVSVLTNHAIVQIAGQPKELFCIDVDLTERKKAEEALRESEEMMRTSQSVAHICSYSTNLKVDDIAKSAWTCSPEFYEIFGIDNTYPHTIEGWVGFIHPDFRDEMVAYHEYVIKEKILFAHEYKIIRISDGAERWVYGTGKLEFDEKGNPIRMYGAIQDITERKKVEIALRENETQYRNLANAGLSLIWMSGTDKLCNYFNDTWLRFTGRTLEQEMGKGWTEGVHPDDFDRCVATYVTAFEKHEAFEIEYRLRHVSGEYRWILDFGTPNYNSKNEFIGYIGNCFDITERKQSEEDFRNLIELSPVPMAIIREWKTLYFNPSAVQLFGASTQNEILNKHIDQFIHPDYCELAIENSKTLAEIGYVEMQEQKYIKLDGSILDVEVQAKRIRFNDAPATLVVINDITKRKQAEEKEKELLNRLELISLHLPGVIYQFRRRSDGTFHFPYASPGIFKIYGVMPKDVEHDASTAFTAIYPDDLDRVSASIYYSADTLTPWHDIYRVNQPSGAIVWVEGYSTPQKLDDGSIIWHGYIQDITDRKKAEEALRDSEEKLRALFSSMTEMVVMNELIFDENGQAIDYMIYDCNNAYVKLMGKTKENIVGKRASELYKIAKMSFLDEYATVVISGETLEHSYYHEPFDKHFLVSAISTEKNKFAIILKDITELKKMYELIDLKNKELENYIYVASHDLRSPLVNIQGFSQRLHKQTQQLSQLLSQIEYQERLSVELSKISTEDIPKSLNFILNNVSKMDTLISGLLQVSRTGRVAINPTALNMNDLFKTILRVFDYQLNERKAKLIMQELEGCFGDANQLNQLFSNIISNAIKYSDKNRALVIEIASEIKYNKVLYSIKDNGIGIPQKQMSKIWDIFYRANSSAEVLGDGIGLSIAKQIADKHNGKIWAESVEGEGTTFFVELYRESFLESKE